MTKREFLIQYVLNRAAAVSGPLDALDAAKKADQAWQVIQANSSEPQTQTTASGSTNLSTTSKSGGTKSRS